MTSVRPQIPVVGLSGVRGVGKTLAAEFLSSLGYERASFADPVREVASAACLFTEHQLEDREAKETVDPRWGLSPREFMQRFATDFVRDQLSLDHWVRHFRLRWERAGCPRVVVDDVRFENEAALLRRMGGKILRLEVDQDREELEADAHISEAGVEGDYTLVYPRWDRGFADLKGMSRALESWVCFPHAQPNRMRIEDYFEGS